jgi:hypothetical protein
MVLFDRSWYNRAGVERVIGFYTDQEYAEFMTIVNGFEMALVLSGLTLIKYWLDITDDTQDKRFQQRIDDRVAGASQPYGPDGAQQTFTALWYTSVTGLAIDPAFAVTAQAFIFSPPLAA